MSSSIFFTKTVESQTHDIAQLLFGQALRRSMMLNASPSQAHSDVAKELKACLHRITELPDVNAFINLDAARAHAQVTMLANGGAQGSLSGFIIGVKDNIHVAGMPCTAGTKALSGFVPKASSPVVEKLEQAGAIILGKTGMHELAYGITSANATFGPVRNPQDTALIAGGSSGGSAAAVAAGFVRAALGTDTGGSVRLPAALTGTVGFRPTVGRYSKRETLEISSTRDTIGLITNNIPDAILMDREILSDTAPRDPVNLTGLRLGVPRSHFYEHLDPEVSKLAELFLQKLEDAGVVLVEADLIDVPELNERTGFPIVLYETGQLLPQYLSDHDTGISIEHLVGGINSPDVAAIISDALGGAISKAAYDEARTVHRPKLQQSYRDYFSQHKVEAVVFPTSPITARPIVGILDGVTVNGERCDTFTTYVRNTEPASNAGIPGISIPAGTTANGQHVGMELDGKEGDDETLLEIARLIESVIS